MIRSIYGLRHGECEDREPRPLTARGKEQAARAADELSKAVGRDALILTATSDRAIETAEIVKRRLDLADERLLHSKRLTAAGASEQGGVAHFGGFIERTLSEIAIPFSGLVVVGSLPLIAMANHDQLVDHGGLVVYEYDPDAKGPDGKYPPERRAGIASAQRLDAIREDWQQSA